MAIINKKILSGFVAAIVIYGLSPIMDAVAAPENNQAENKKATEPTSKSDAILFRIENIQPVKDEKGSVIKCTYTVMAYNRMNKGLDEAELEINLIDNVANKFVIEKGGLKVNDNKENNNVVATSSVKLNKLRPHMQRSFPVEVETDKCYLLFDAVDYSIKSCKIEGETADAEVKASDNKKTACADRFNYIDARNVEYYSEFKDTPDSEAENEDEEAKKNELTKIDEERSIIVQDVQNVKDILSGIK